MRYYTTRAARWVALALRMLLGLFFVVSAVAKWVDLDRFEVYVFSLQLFSLHASFLLARLLIVCELLVGIGLLSNLCNRWVNGCTVLLLTGFSLLLGYVILIGRTDSCQCMGAWLDISPTLSLLKNAVLLLLLVPASRCQPWPWRPRWYVWLPVTMAPFLLVFITSAPDNWMFPADNGHYDAAASAFVSEPALRELHLDEERHAVLFLTPGCRFCQLADQKVTAIRHRHQIDSTRIHYIVPAQLYRNYAAATDAVAPYSMPVIALEDSTFRRITGGMRPLFMLIDAGKLQTVSHYRNIDERQIVDFFDK